MQEIAKGNYVYEYPEIVMSDQSLDLVAVEGSNIKGVVKLWTKNNVPIKGIVYTTEGKMALKEQQFEGMSVEISYEFHTEGLIEGNEVTGSFHFVCNGGEYSLPFVVSISKEYARTSVGKVETLGQFLKLAREQYDEAYALFVSPIFSNLIIKDDAKSQLLCQGLVYRNATKLNMEEFLLALGLKESVGFSVVDEPQIFKNIYENESREIILVKEGWGYGYLDVSTDCPYIALTKFTVTTDEFQEDHLVFSYIIDANMLHRGKNYGRIIFANNNQTFIVETCVDLSGETNMAGSVMLRRQALIKELSKEYIEYRLKKMSPAMWADSTLQGMEKLSGLTNKDELMSLMRAQVLYFCGRKQDSDWLMEAYRKSRPDKNSINYAYYLYLTTLSNRDKGYVRRVADKVENIYVRNTESLLLFWIRLFINEDVAYHRGRKLQTILERMKSGCSSPYIYVEAWQVLAEDPLLVRNLEPYMVRLLLWASREDVLTKDVVIRVMELIKYEKHYSRSVHKILVAAYDKWQDSGVLEAICKNLLRGSCYREEDLIWYQRGIEEDLRLTNLYEAYLRCTSEWEESKYPKVVQYYLQYETKLPYRQKAALYASMIQNKDQQKSSYEHCREDIAIFALSQMSEGRIDENLAIVYEDYLKGMAVGTELAKTLSSVIFEHKLVVEAPEIERVILYQRELKQEMMIPLVKHTAKLPIVSEDFVLIFEDRKGRRFNSSVPYTLVNYMDHSISMKNCMMSYPELVEYLIGFFDGEGKSYALSDELIPYVEAYLQSDYISEMAKQQMCTRLLDKLLVQGQASEIQSFITYGAMEYLDLENRGQLMVLAVRNHLYHDGYNFLLHYGNDGFDPSFLVEICTNEIEAIDGVIDDHLLLLCFKTLSAEAYTLQVVEYLAKNYCGTIDEMVELWKKAKNFQVDTYDLEERILVQLQFVNRSVDCVNDLFIHYIELGGKELIREAYVSAFAKDYVIKDKPAINYMLLELEHWYNNGHQLHNCEKLALLKGYTDRTDLTKEQEILAKELYNELMTKHMVLSFFANLPSQITIDYPIMNQYILEIRSNPQDRVVLHYQIAEKGDFDEQHYQVEEMNQIGYGIFTKELILFFGEELSYFVVENKSDQIYTSSVEHISYTTLETEGRQDRYSRLNAMLYDKKMGKLQGLAEKKEEYETILEQVDREFTLI